MIVIEISDNNTIKVIGHGNNESCARATTIFDIFIKIMGEPEQIERSAGISYVSYGELKTKQKKEFFELFCECYKELNIMYPGMTSIIDYRKKDKKEE